MGALSAVCLALVGCGEHKVDATQVAARVNSSDITVHQINFLLQQDRNLKAEATDAARKKVLEGLIDQELAVQKSVELKLDRDPQVVQELEAVRREVLARAYRERITQGGAKPGGDEARRFYDESPVLFKERRVYSLQELVIDVPQDKVAWVKQAQAKVKSADEFAEALKAEGLRYTGSHAVKPAEQLPMGLVERFAQMKDGDSAVLSEAPNLRIVFIAGSRMEPVSFERAEPAINQYLATRAKLRAVDDNLKALRTAAQITYQGIFVGGPGAAASAGAVAPTTMPVQINLPEGSPEPVKLAVPDAAPLPGTAGSAIDPNVAKKGMGLK